MTDIILNASSPPIGWGLWIVIALALFALITSLRNRANIK